MEVKQIYLRPGSVIKNLRTQEDLKLGKGIFVTAKAISKNRDYYLVFDKTNKPSYLARAEYVVEFDKEIQMLPNVDAQTTYPAPSIFKSNNSTAFFDTQFNLHLDNLQNSAYNNIPYALSTSKAVGNRLEIRTLYNSSLPVNFGLTMNYETSSWTTVTEFDTRTTHLNIFSIGPQIQRYVYEEDNIAVSLLLGAEYAPIYTLATDVQNDHYSGMLLDFGAEVLWGTDWGKWSIGAHFRKHDLTLNSTTSSGLIAVPESINVNSIGGMLGYKYEWDL